MRIRNGSTQAPWLLTMCWAALYTCPLMGQPQEPMDTVDVLAELITVEDGPVRR